MKITVKYFGLLADITQTNEELFSIEETDIPLCRLRKVIEEKYPSISESNFITAVNQSISDSNTMLNNNDIIALLPPFAGG